MTTKIGKRLDIFDFSRSMRYLPKEVCKDVFEKAYWMTRSIVDERFQNSDYKTLLKVHKLR